MLFYRESYRQTLIEEMYPMWHRHHAEVAAYKDIVLNPNLAMYEACDKLGTLRIFTAREGSTLVGYQLFFVSPHPHSMQSIQAVQDILYIEKEYRKGLAGYKFIKWCVDALKKEGIQCIYQHISNDFDFGKMLIRMGYTHVDQVYGLRG